MAFRKTKLKDAYIIETRNIADERGYFARAWCKREFEEQNLDVGLVQINKSFNFKKGTLRGMHFQKEPHGEVKLVRCTAGRICDVIVDIRKDSPTYLQWEAFELSQENGLMLYVPKCFAHGYITLEDNSEVYYQVSEYYQPESESGIYYADPVLGIKWPIAVEVISEKDKKLPHIDEGALC